MDGVGDFKELSSGISQIKHFIFSEAYNIDKAILDSAKAAYIVILIRFRTGQIEKFNEPKEIRDWIIEQPFFTRLNKLKKTNPEAFFYWYKTYKIIPQHGSK